MVHVVVVILYIFTVWDLREVLIMLFLLYCIPLHSKVWQRNGCCCFCYIGYHYRLRFDREVIHVVAIILSTITVLDLREEWFVLFLLYCIPLHSKVWQRNGCCCFCYIGYHWCGRIDRGVVHVVGYCVYHYCLRFDRGVVHALFVLLSTITLYSLSEEWLMLFLLYWQWYGCCCFCYIGFHCCLRFDR